MDDAAASPHWPRVAHLRPSLLAQVSVHRQELRGEREYLLSNDAAGVHHRVNDAAYQFISRCYGRCTVQQVWYALIQLNGDRGQSPHEVLQTMRLKPLWRSANALRWAALSLLPFLCCSMLSHAQQPFGCLIEPDYVAEVGSQVVGVIESLQVERGQRVNKGQVIALLRADVERAAVGVARSRSDAVADIQAANVNAIFGKQRLDRAKDLLAQNFISEQAYDQIKTEADVAAQKLAQAQEQCRLAQRELELANSQLAMRTVRSPVNGVVVERYMAVGERIEEKPMVRIAVVDPLRVQVVVPSSMYGRVALNASASITPELPNASAVSARVILIDKMLDSASNTFRVTLSLPNPGNALPAGLRCRADFGLGVVPATSAARRAPHGKLDVNLPEYWPVPGAGAAKSGKVN